MRHEGEDASQQGAGKLDAENPLPLTSCGLGHVPAPPGLRFLLVQKECTAGHFLSWYRKPLLLCYQPLASPHLDQEAG